MFCNEFPSVIISVRLLREGKDITFYDSFGYLSPTISIGGPGKKSGVSASLSSNDLHKVGTLLLMETEDATIKHNDKVGTQGVLEKTVLSYSFIYTPDSASDFNNQILMLRRGHFSLLIEFFGGIYALVRCDADGIGWAFSKEFAKGKYNYTITIQNTNAMQMVRGFLS